MDSTAGGATIVRSGRKPDWATESLNSVVGKLAEVAMNDPQKNSLAPKQRFPRRWLTRVEELLALPGDQRRHALVIFTHNTRWFFAIDPDWTKTNLLPAFMDEGPDRDAAWSGFFWAAKLPSPELFALLKPHFLDVAKPDALPKEGYERVIAGMLLAAWASRNGADGGRFVSSAELRQALKSATEDFRSHSLWQLRTWVKAPDSSFREHLAEFMRDVWPRQKSFATAQASARLCELALTDLPCSQASSKPYFRS